MDSCIEDNNSNNNNNKLWIINKKCYNLDPFLEKHPGGKKMLLLNKGRDCTELFYTYHALSKKKIGDMMEKYYIRDAKPYEIETPFNWDNQDVYSELKQLVIKYFDNNGITSKATSMVWIIYAVWTLITLITYYYWFRGYWITLPIVSLIGMYYSGEILHDATHYSIHKSAYINELLSYVGIYHCLPTTWYHQHVILHHSYTNINNKDPDLNHFKNLYGKSGYGWRTNEFQTYIKQYGLWRRFLLLVMIMASYGSNIIRSLHILRSGWYMKIIKVRFINLRGYISFVSQLLLLLSLPFIMIYNFGIIKGLALTFLPRFLHGIMFYLISQVSHISPEALDKNKLTKHNPKKEWAVHQILSTIDYSVESYFWNYFTQGLNNQAAHHLFPSIHPIHYPEINKIIKSVTEKYNIPYIYYNNYFGALYHHLRHLSVMNDK